MRFRCPENRDGSWHGVCMALQVLDMTRRGSDDALRARHGVVVAVGNPADVDAADHRLDRASLALTETGSSDHRWVQVPSVSAALQEIEDRVAQWPQAAAVCDDVLRAIDPGAPTFAGVTTESLAYSTLQSGAEFTQWLVERGAAAHDDSADPVLADRVGDRLEVRLNRGDRHNAFSTNMRAALLDALEVARLDHSVTEVVLSGAGPSFCSGGDLKEFGTFTDPATAHLARTRHSPALVLDDLSRRLGRRCRAQIHGQVLGSGLEMAAFCGHVACRSDAVLGLPELRLGLIPGAGGTVSVTRRIGRWRTAYLVLTGNTIDAATALHWGLVDSVSD